MSQLGGAAGSPRHALATVPGLPRHGIMQISAGGAHSVAVANDNSVWGWGEDRDGQLGGRGISYC